jgi:hypothetical protein
MRKNILLRSLAAGALLAAGFLLGTPLRAQGVVDLIPPEVDIQRAAGQSVQPFFEGWQRNPDGSISMWFGYLNRNQEEEVDVPVGADNKLEPLGLDAGQPTHFLTHPRRHMFVFKVNLPRDWDKDKRLTWTITAHGQTNSAYGWMQREWEVDDGVREENGNGVNRGQPHYDPPNLPPTITGTGSLTATVGQALKLTATANDDGIPEPRRRPLVGPDGATVPQVQGRPQGLWVRWTLYRAPVSGGKVSFSQESTVPVHGKPVEASTDATFTAPGQYWLQAIANDGNLDTSLDIKVTVQ